MSAANRGFKGKTGTLYLRNVPAQLRNNFAAACARRGKPMKEVLVDFMRRYSKDDTTVTVTKGKK